MEKSVKAGPVNFERLFVSGGVAAVGVGFLSPASVFLPSGGGISSFVDGVLPFGVSWWGAAILATGLGGILSSFRRSVQAPSSPDWVAPAAWRRSLASPAQTAQAARVGPKSGNELRHIPPRAASLAAN